jgi:hypothetical protein
MIKHATDRHHVVPRSRCYELGIDPDFDGNVIRVNQTKHRALHILFGNMLPEEMIEHIKTHWSLDKDGEQAFQNELKRRGLK